MYASLPNCDIPDKQKKTHLKIFLNQTFITDYQLMFPQTFETISYPAAIWQYE